MEADRNDDGSGRKADQKAGNAKQHDDVQGGGGGSAGGGGPTKHAEGTKSEHAKNDRTGSGTHESRRTSTD